MKKYLFTFIWMQLLMVPLIAQDVNFSGIITDQATQEPLIGATIIANNIGTISDFDGLFEMSLREGTHQVTISFVGYEDKQLEIVITADALQNIDIALAESENILNTATVTSGKFEKALSEVTVSMEVIKPQLIENTNQTSLSGLLDKVPGVTMVGDQANIRGGSGFSYGAGSRVLLLVDDMPILQADAGFPQWEDVPIESIEQLEVVKGAASALYGSSALNGIINARTAYAKAKPVTKISPFYTYFSDPKDEEQIWWNRQPYANGASISHKQKFGKFDLVAGGYYLNRTSTNEDVFTERYRMNINTRYRITDQLSVGINSNLNRSQGRSFFFWKGAGADLRRGASNTYSDGKSLRYNIDPFITYFDKNNGRHKLQSRFLRTGNDNDADTDQSNKSNVNYYEYQYQKNFDALNLIATSGLVYTQTAVKAPLYADTTLMQKNIAGFLQLDKKIGDKLNISAGFRYERNNVVTPEVFDYELVRDNGNVLNFRDTIPNGKIKESRPVFRFGLNYELTPATFLRASWGEGYRFPTIAEKFIFTLFGGVPINPNFDLESETGWTGEIGIKQGFQIDGFKGFVDIAGFWSQYENMIEFVFPGFSGFQSRNVGGTRINGLEVSLAGNGRLFGMPTTLLAGYTYLDPKFKEFDITASGDTEAGFNAQQSSICNDPRDPDKENCKNILKYRSRHSMKIDVESQLNDWRLGVSAIYNSHIENIDAIFEALIVPGLQEFRQNDENGYVELSARVAYQATEILKISLIGNNLLNQDYSSRPGQLTPTRNITARMDFQF